MGWLMELFRGEKRNRQLDREVQHHLEQMEADYIAAGLSANEARRRARIEFGAPEAVKEQCREARRAYYIEQFIRDLHHSLRGWRRDRGFSAVFILVIALGVSVNTAVFTVVQAVLLRPLPYEKPERIVRLFQFKEPQGRHTVSPPNYLDWRVGSNSMEAMAAYQGQLFELPASEGTDQISGVRVSADLFRVLGTAPRLGRAFTAEEDSPSGAPVVILSDELWRSRFQEDPEIIGKAVRLGAASYTVVGIMPPGFWFPLRQTALLTPLRIGDPTHRMRRSENYLNVAGRLKPNVTLEQARDDLSRVARQLEITHPFEDAGLRVDLAPLEEVMFGNTRNPLLVLQAAVFLVLLIACSNLALLQLARASVRLKEHAVRTTLGASFARLARQSLAESLLLTTAGVGASLLLTWWVIETFAAWIPATLPRYQDIGIDGTVASFALGLAVITIALVGWIPAATAWKANVVQDLQGTRTSPDGRKSFLRDALILSQVALSSMLLLGAGLLIRSIANLLEQDAGFETKNALTISVAAPEMTGTKRIQHMEELRMRLATIPGVASAGFVNISPLVPETLGTRFTIASQPLPSPESVPTAAYRVVSQGYFRAMGARILSGRDFDTTDTGVAPVFIINETMAKKFWPSRNPIGERIRRGGVDSKSEYGPIVGIVADMKQQDLETAPAPEIFIAYPIFPLPGVTFAVRSQLNPGILATSVRRTILSHHSGNRIGHVRTLDELVNENVRPRMFNLGLLSAFAVLALALAGAGIYGVVSYAVNTRTREFGIRLALGASAGGIYRLVIFRVLRLVTVGIIIGLVGAWMLSRLLATQLYGVSNTDPETYIATTGVLTLLATLAAYLPARRAARIDPAAAIRSEC